MNRCVRGRHCYAAEADGDQLVGAPTDRPLCPVCEQAVARALDDAPALYVRLRGATLTRGQGDRGPQVSISRGSPMPLNAAALHLGEELHWLLTTWEDEVRSIAGLTYPHRDGKREGRQVADAARLLSAWLTAWTSAPPTELATSRWTDDVEQSGAQAAAQLLTWRATVRRLPGLDVTAPKAVRRYEQRCPACGVRAITHRAGDDLMHCQNCGATSPYLPTLPREADYQEAAS
ncbi:hypothetical protein [Blastococcus sp. SYSU D00813]